MNTARWTMGWTVCVWILVAGQALAQGSLTPPGPPGPTMKSLDQVEARIPITNLPYVINSPGSYYLTQNLTGSSGNYGVVINANDVALDLNGFRLTGVAGSLDGIAVGGSRSGICIRNGSVRNWSGQGVNAWNASHSVFEDLRTDVGDGDGLMAGENCSVKNCSAAGNGGRGFRLAKNSQIRNCVAAQNAAAGIYTDSGCLIEGCQTSTNNAGIVAELASIIRNCTVRDNATNGIQVAAHGTIADCVAEDNAGHGFRLGSDSQIRDCIAQHNTSAGIWTEDGCAIEGCTATYNDEGIAAENASTIRGCTVRKNDVDGIRVSYRCTVAENVAEDNGHDGVGAGIHATGNGNRITGNHVVDGDFGLFLEGTGSVVADNTVMGSDDNYNFALGNELNLLLCEIPETLDWPCAVQLAGTLYCTVPATNGITVNADNVSIDLAGHSLTGPGEGSGHGICALNPRENILVRNGTVDYWLNSADNAIGIYADRCTHIVENMHSRSNGYGIVATGPGHVTGCSATKCTYDGFVINGAVVNCSAAYNGGDGFQGGEAEFSSCFARYNGGDGFDGGSTLHNCMSSYNMTNGFTVWGGTLTGCWAEWNKLHGFQVLDAAVNDCVAHANYGDGIYVSSDQFQNPVYLLNNTCTQNGFSGADGAGIRVTQARCRIEGNLVAYNDRGIEVESTGNFIVRNTAATNGVNWVVAASNVCLVVAATPTAAAINGDSGGTAPGSTDPNANFTLP